MIRIWHKAAMILAATLPGTALAQSTQCNVPAVLPRPHADLPTAQQPRRVIPIGSYTLAITWSPQYCRGQQAGSDSFQCGQDNRFGFTLHGLWPDGEGKTWPQYCKPVALLPQAVVRKHLCATPSVQLLQHEYAKHGSCMGVTPAAYFARSNALYGRLRFPNMDALSRRRDLTAGQLAQAIARANPGIAANMMRITANREGWLDEVWLCLDKRLRYRACPAHQGGLTSNAPLKIWRGHR
ncbi:ribonuclease T2 [Sphingomonas sp. PL-96]|uniref:ribonuclease T2 n=1 Tax=Sphingomonas sp. PL-96 TaxID=2887201 RepID=UPI001E37A499|nr:ribonuclease T2 [Sphingomonas sp. PL-96]MCC2975430.1 ribonuclease T2 [Sphingomonas sp. PL-96]